MGNLKRNQKNSGVEKYNNWNEKFTRGIQRQFEQAKERISKCDNKTIEIIESKEQKKKTE